MNIINNYIKRDQNNNDYIEVYYNYYDYTNKEFRSMLIHISKKNLIIPKGTLLYGNKINENVIAELLSKSLLKINNDESLSIKNNFYIKKVYFEFNQDYRIDTFKLKDFFDIVGCIDRYRYNFSDSIIYMNRSKYYNNLTSIMNQIIETLIKKEYPQIYGDIFNGYLYRTYFGFLIRLLFFDSKYKIKDELFNLDNINDLIKFFNEWTGNKYLSQYYFYDDFSKAKTINKKIWYLYENNLIIEKHYKKLKRLSNKQNSLIDYIINKIDKSTIEYIKEIYDLIDSEDELLYINKPKNCIIL